MSHLASIPFLDRPTDTNASKVADIGALRIHVDPTLGTQLYRMVQATAQIEDKECVMYDAGASLGAVKTTGAAVKACAIAGIAVSQILINQYGWVCCSGQVVAIADSTMGAGSTIFSGGTAGQVDDLAPAGNEHCVLGVSVSGGGSGGADVTVRLSGLV